MRATCSGTIRLGLVAIPVKMYLAASARSTRFFLVTPAGNRVNMRMVDSATGEAVRNEECGRGYDVGDDTTVVFSKDEVKSMDEEGDGALDIDRFVPEEELEALRVERTYFVGPAKGGDRAYDLLRYVMWKERRMAIVRWTNRGKQHALGLRGEENRIVAHQLFRDDEVRDFTVRGPSKPPSDAELAAAFDLVGSHSVPELDLSGFVDEREERVRAAVDRKLKGLPPEENRSPPAKEIDDLLEALRASARGK